VHGLKTILNQYLAEAADRFLQTDVAYRHNSRRGLISPHIDFARGGVVYADVWRRMTKAAQQADLVVIVGTDHHGNDDITLTTTHYKTPYGVLPTDLSIVGGLAEAIGVTRAFKGERRHTNEHSLELPLVWLHHMRQGEPCYIVPVLVGTLGQYDTTDSPMLRPTVSAFLDSLASLTQNRNVLMIASGDMSHVGPAFGGDPLDAVAKSNLQAEDKALIEMIDSGDAEQFFTSIASTANYTNVCGTSPIYLTMKWLNAHKCQTNSYEMCSADKWSYSVVSIAGTTIC
jgi:hypothetical protein